jgi:hypothetical protein
MFVTDRVGMAAALRFVLQQLVRSQCTITYYPLPCRPALAAASSARCPRYSSHRPHAHPGTRRGQGDVGAAPRRHPSAAPSTSESSVSALCCVRFLTRASLPVSSWTVSLVRVFKANWARLCAILLCSLPIF